MPRYFFHTADGSRARDTAGTELGNIAAARREAIMFLSACMLDEPSILGNGQDFRVKVTDATDMLLFVVVALAIDTSASRPLPKPANAA